ncbi:MAG: sugar ABC transporter permease [Bifidobacteriaceae bacterium]|jgi:multiple sugar transport system permease protein|nr:sugar ABC transporter permease [Bifidobacteriaceae bacterium]
MRSLGRTRRKAGEALTAWALLTPSLIGVVLFMLVPIAIVVWLSFYRWNLISPPRFVGLANWVGIMTNGRFANSLLVTGAFVLIVIPTQTALGLFFANLLHRRLPGSGFFRTLYVLPWVCAPIAVGVMWTWVLAPSHGALNTLIGHRIEWLSDQALALPSVALVSVWSQVGYVTLFFLSGLGAIPETITEAAQLDGAGRLRIFWTITVPLLRPTLFFVLLTTAITAAQTFDTVYVLTGGGPLYATDVVGARIYYEAFQNHEFGSAAAMALVVFILLAAMALLQKLYFDKRTTYDLST